MSIWVSRRRSVSRCLMGAVVAMMISCATATGDHFGAARRVRVLIALHLPGAIGATAWSHKAALAPVPKRSSRRISPRSGFGSRWYLERQNTRRRQALGQVANAARESGNHAFALARLVTRRGGHVERVSTTG